MNRRDFVTALGAVLAAPLAAESQSTGNIPRIGFITTASPPGSSAIEAFRSALRDLGYVEGRNIAIEWRWGRGTTERFSEFALELVRAKVDVIVATNTAAGHAAQGATKTIPIVIPTMVDPIDDGFVRSFPRPEGNITGLMLRAPELHGKRLQLFKEAVPTISAIALLVESGLTRRTETNEAEAAAHALGVRLQPVVEVRDAGELDAAFAKIIHAGAHGVFVVGRTTFFANQARLAALALKSRVPMMCDFREEAEAGCLMSYGPNLEDQFRRAAAMVNRIVKGAKPAELPVEQPTKFELVINLKTAKALGLTIPPSLLLRADQVIE
jgi:putative tryptophan/tyrosine transport system substrate-binding protein